jgi:multiple sugar transport system ATP-binding protein
MYMKKPENVFVGGFIGSPAMNIFNGKLEDGKYTIGNKSSSVPDWNMNKSHFFDTETQ